MQNRNSQKSKGKSEKNTKLNRKKLLKQYLHDFYTKRNAGL